MRKLWIAALAAVVSTGPVHAAEDAVLVGSFSATQPGDRLPSGWDPLDLRNIERATRYSIVTDSGTNVLRAESKASASGIAHRLQLDPSEYAWLRWRWKASNIIKNADLARKEGDDFPARLYVMFDYPMTKLNVVERSLTRLARLVYGDEVPLATLCYVWDGKASVGTIVPSAYTSRVRMIVVQSGPAHVNEWVAFERNVLADFQAAFGEPPARITGVAVAVDTDNTGEAVTTHFGNISFHKHDLKQ
jgi:hypothetical protein